MSKLLNCHAVSLPVI